MSSTGWSTILIDGRTVKRIGCKDRGRREEERRKREGEGRKDKENDREKGEWELAEWEREGYKVQRGVEWKGIYLLC